MTHLVSDKSVCKCRVVPCRAMMHLIYNDTSVIRGPATMKAGRCKSYELLQLRSAEWFPYIIAAGDVENKYSSTLHATMVAN